MKTVICAINAKFIHSCLSAYSLKANAKEYFDIIDVVEFTINNYEQFIIGQLYEKHPDILCFPCYIWNIEMVGSIASIMKKVLPNTKIVLGGPEVSYEYFGVFEKGADYVIIGEGEQTFYELLCFFDGRARLEDISGLAYKDKDMVLQTGKRQPCNLNDLRFPYEHLDFSMFKHRILYYETSRGCPFCCQYCLSSLEDSGVRFLDFAHVKENLDIFLESEIRQVKFVDRTFNCNKAHALNIWKYIIENDNGITNFHFEISADLLDDEMLCILKDARKSQIQFEIGVQSTNLSTLDHIKRKTNLTKLFVNVDKLSQMGNIHLHLDLIAGLPEEDYDSFGRSFDDVFSHYPAQLQLGFLKLLKGSGLREKAEEFGIAYNDNPPYNVLFTKDISFGQMLELHTIEELVETYYNSNKFMFSIRFISSLYDRPFCLFEKLVSFWRENGFDKAPNGKEKIYEILFDFCSEKHQDNIKEIRDLLMFDLLMADNIKNTPSWLGQIPECNNVSRQFYNNHQAVARSLPEYSSYTAQQLSRMCAIKVFDFNIPKWAKNGFKELKKSTTYVLFDYKTRLDVPGVKTFHASYHDITKEINELKATHKKGDNY